MVKLGAADKVDEDERISLFDLILLPYFLLISCVVVIVCAE